MVRRSRAIPWGRRIVFLVAVAPRTQRRIVRWAIPPAAAGVIGGATWLGVQSSATPTITAEDRIDRVIAGVEREPDWSLLERDLTLVRPTFTGSSAQVFELVVALRGLSKRGVADFERAEQACHAAGFARCERRSLEEMRAQTHQVTLDLALEELAWHHGDATTLREAIQARRLAADASDQAKERAARTRLRLAVVAPSPDARAALLSEVCALRPSSCDALPAALERMAATRPDRAEFHLLSPQAAETGRQ